MSTQAPRPQPTRYTKRHTEKATLRRLGITQDDVAAEAGVHRTMVCHVLAGRCTSVFVHAAIRRLVARARGDHA